MATIKRGGLQYNIGPNQRFIPEEAPKPSSMHLRSNRKRKPGRLRRLWGWLLKRKKR